MENAYSLDDLLDFLSHASDRGLMPAATAKALAIAARTVFGVLNEEERRDLWTVDIEGVIKRFNNKRARDFNPKSLQTYGQRTRRAVEDFIRWRDDPAKFSVKTRAAVPTKKGKRNTQPELARADERESDEPAAPRNSGGYSSSFPVRPGWVVTISNIPSDLTAAEAERLAQLVKLLVIG